MGIIGGIIFLFVLVGIFLPLAQRSNPGGDNTLPPELGGPARPQVGPEGAFITVMIVIVVIGVLFSAYNLFSERGVAAYDIDIDGDSSNSETNLGEGDFDVKLRDLAHNSEMSIEPADEPSRPVAGRAGSKGDFDSRLRKLTRLKEDGLITADEFERKRAEIMNQPW